MAQHGEGGVPKQMKKEPLSPGREARDDSQHSHSMQNGCSDLSSNEGTDYDAPLDFSIKKKTNNIDSDSKSVKQEKVNHVNGILDRVPGEPDKPHTPEEEDKIGEPQTALPGTLPGMTVSGSPGVIPGIHAGLLPNSGLMGTVPFMMDPRRMQGLKSTRPFKAYPKDPLSLPLGYFGIPGMMPLPGLDVATVQALSVGSEEMFNQYRQQLLNKNSRDSIQDSGGRDSKENDSVTSGHDGLTSDSDDASADGDRPQISSTSSGFSTTTSTATTSTTSTSNVSAPAVKTATLPTSVTSPTTSSTTQLNNSRKRPRVLPEEQKDQAYWERRRKNNEAAKRSRDARRAKEDEIAIRAAFLEQENLKLRVEVAALKNETAKLRCMLYNS